jgi:hypothetical protein
MMTTVMMDDDAAAATAASNGLDSVVCSVQVWSFHSCVIEDSGLLERDTAS